MMFFQEFEISYKPKKKGKRRWMWKKKVNSVGGAGIKSHLSKLPFLQCQNKISLE
jgi:hypothetical protein